MELHTTIFFPVEIIGTIAFASSGALTAIRILASRYRWNLPGIKESDKSHMAD